ncbi:MAG: OsmC family protein [Bacteroidetes bacterium]|nr:OsmC family protein [Bacteroidota bacterium]
MKHSIDCKWTDKMAFEATVNDHKIIFDADPTVGGEDAGARPKPVILASLAGCSGMDVISILAKMKVIPTYFNIIVEGELTEEHPKVYNKIHVVYEFKGENLEYDKLKKAVDLSQDRYCGVSAMLKLGAQMTYCIKILD